MKYLIIVFALLYSCKKADSDRVKSKIDTQPKIHFYEFIFDELKKIDTNQFYITYEIINDYTPSLEIKQALVKNKVIIESEADKLSDKFINTDYSLELSSKTESILNSSKIMHSKKTELNYTFSKPYQIDENKILILNSVKYRDQLSQDVKGGSERAIIFIKENNNWKIKQIETLNEI
ncbi:hypothetical protein [Confluentibacter sediminis]|uniref:hypothetical protein n=1 Tax=Confluentibacter sediminis TaxID=2219045 RepID=UPI000DABDA65|nr:hypothetical protein [Confluentibacter sediminis]